MENAISRKLKYYWFESQYRLLRWFWSKTETSSKIDGYAIVYHHVTDGVVDTIPSCICKVQIFEQTIKQIQNEGRKIVSPNEAIQIIQKKSSEPFAIITFDDVPSNFMGEAYPILVKYQAPFTLFITSGFMAKDGYLTEKQVLELAKDPLCTIGGHTVTHKKMRYNKDSFLELKRSKEQLEKLIGNNIYCFAYPFGRQSTVSRRNIKEVKRAGYSCAFSTIDVKITDLSSQNLFFLPRVVIN